MSRIAILSIHGIGQQRPGFAEKFHKKLTHNLKDYEVRCFEFEWQHLIEPEENIQSKKANSLKWKITRSFAFNYVGDAVAYAKDSIFYKSCHKALDQKLKEINEWVGDGDIYIIAHSLGTIITYNFIYNMQNIEALGNKIFKTKDVTWIDKLDCVFFLGSPLSIYSLQKNAGGKPFLVNNWFNIYSPYDVIGYPVKSINKDFENSNVRDISIICGNLFTFWNPFSHLAYFDSNAVMKLIVNRIKGF